MKMLSRGLILLFFLTILSIQGAADQTSSFSSSSSSGSKFEVNASRSISFYVDSEIIRGHFGLELLFTPTSFFSIYRDYLGFIKRKYIDIDLEKCAKAILWAHADVIEPLYQIFAMIKSRPDFDLQKVIRFIGNSSIGQSEQKLQKAKELVDQYFVCHSNIQTIIRNLSVYGLKQRLRSRNGIINEVLFSPMNVRDDCTKIEETLVWLIEAENESICVASYYFTNDNIVWALHDAKNRGVKVQVITDDNPSSIAMLREYEFPFKKWKKTGRHSQMHHKFLLFGNNIYDSTIVASGSYNITNNANNQPENMMFTNDPRTYDTFKREFQKLTRNSDLVFDESEDESEYLSCHETSSSDNTVALLSEGIQLQIGILAFTHEQKGISKKRKRE